MQSGAPTTSQSWRLDKLSLSRTQRDVTAGIGPDVSFISVGGSTLSSLKMEQDDMSTEFS